MSKDTQNRSGRLLRVGTKDLQTLGDRSLSGAGAAAQSGRRPRGDGCYITQNHNCLREGGGSRRQDDGR